MPLALLNPFLSSFLFFFTDTATTEIYTLSLHDALPIFEVRPLFCFFGIHAVHVVDSKEGEVFLVVLRVDRKSTRLNSSHLGISYAVFCLKKKKTHSAVDDDHGVTGTSVHHQRERVDRRR